MHRPCSEIFRSDRNERGARNWSYNTYRSLCPSSGILRPSTREFYGSFPEFTVRGCQEKVILESISAWAPSLWTSLPSSLSAPPGSRAVDTKSGRSTLVRILTASVKLDFAIFRPESFKTRLSKSPLPPPGERLDRCHMSFT